MPLMPLRGAGACLSPYRWPRLFDVVVKTLILLFHNSQILGSIRRLDFQKAQVPANGFRHNVADPQVGLFQLFSRWMAQTIIPIPFATIIIYFRIRFCRTNWQQVLCILSLLHHRFRSCTASAPSHRNALLSISPCASRCSSASTLAITLLHSITDCISPHLQ